MVAEGVAVCFPDLFQNSILGELFQHMPMEDPFQIVNRSLFDDPLHPMSMEEDAWFDETMMVLMFIMDDENKRTMIAKIPQRISMLRGYMYMDEMLYGPNPASCYEVFRLKRPTFMRLCNTLREEGYFKESQELRVEESLGIFCYIVGHREGMRMAADRFQHSTETISRHFKWMMRALCRLGRTLLAPKEPVEAHSYVRSNPKYYPWFKNCVGAIDGTMVSAWSRKGTMTAFRNRKSDIAQNVLAVCDFDMMFTFVYTGWEGSAHDSRVFYDAISREENQFPLPPEGHFYLVDSGFPLMKGFLPPYKGARYHLSSFRRNRIPRGKKELFNYNHSSLRNVIERCFGALKAHFEVLENMPRYLPTRQPIVVTACCTLHNWCRIYQRNDAIFSEHSGDARPSNGRNRFRHDLSGFAISRDSARAMSRERDAMADMMWGNRG